MYLNSGENDNVQNFNLKNLFYKGENDRGYYGILFEIINIFNSRNRTYIFE